MCIWHPYIIAIGMVEYARIAHMTRDSGDLGTDSLALAIV